MFGGSNKKKIFNPFLKFQHRIPLSEISQLLHSVKVLGIEVDMLVQLIINGVSVVIQTQQT